MTTESVDIKIDGSVKPDIEKNIRAIANAASSGYTSLYRLQAMLNQLDSGGLSRLQSAQASVTRATTNSTTATTRQASATTTARDRMLELARAGIAEAQAERDRANAIFEAARATNTMNTSIRQQVAFTQEQIRAAQEATRAARDQIAATRQMTDAQDALQRSQQRTSLGWQDYNTGLAKTSQNAQLARHHMVNLGFQLQDIGVSLASGQNPLTVAIQQGAQIQGIAAQAGVGLRGLAAGVGRLLAGYAPLAVAIGAITAGLKIMSTELSKSANLEAYSKSLGLTTKQIKQLDGDVVTITDTFKAFFTTLSQETGAGAGFDAFLTSATKTFKNIVAAAVDMFNMIGALSSATAQSFLVAWRSLPTGFRNIFIDIYNTVVGIVEALVNFTIAGVNQMITGLNKIAQIKIDPIAVMPFERMDYAKDDPNAKSMADTFMDTFQASFAARNKEFADFYAKWQANSVKAAQARIKAGADGLGGKSEENRAAAMAKINAQLDNELSRLTMLKPVREEQAKFDQIQEQLLGRKIRLNDEEAASIRNKIAAITEEKAISQQMDRIYEEIQGSSEEYAASLQAIDRLLQQGFLNQEQYNAKIQAANEAFENAQDPLRKYRQEMQFQIETMGVTGQQLDILSQRRQIEQEALRNGIALRKEDTDALMKQAEAAQYAQGVQQQYNQIYAENGGELEQMRQRADALSLAYQNGMITQGAYITQMAQLGTQAAQLRIAMDQALPGDAFAASFGRLLDGYKNMISGVTTALGDMFVTLQDGFANALAGAIMGTESLGDALRNVATQAVQQLIASLIKLGVQWAINAALSQTLGMAVVASTASQAALTATAWAPAAALASLATLGANAGPATIGMGSTMVAAKSFAMLGGVGFMNGGYTGNGAVDEIAGVVHGKEYVMRADTVSRLGIDTMDAIQNGRPLTATSSSALGIQGGGNVGTGSVTITIINNADGTKATTTQTDNGQGGQDITVTIDSIENALASRVESGQGSLSRSMQKSFGIQHQTERR